MRAILFSFVILLFIACQPHERAKNSSFITNTTAKAAAKEIFEPGQFYPSVACATMPSESFALYLPHQYSEEAKLQAMIFFDPHGDGSYPLSKYTTLADEYGFILLGSNNAKNGVTFEETSHIVEDLISEINSRFKIGNGLIALAGFSGGSRVALQSAMNHSELIAVIYCGAAMKPEQAKSLPAALGIAGRYDMNYTEVIALDNALERMNSPHCLVEWNGKHEWSDSVIFKNAFQWSTFNAMKKGLVANNEELVQKFMEENLKPSSNVIDEELRLRKIIAFTKGLADVSSIEQKRIALIASTPYKKAIAARDESFEIENKMRKNYAQCIDTKDLNWWKEEIARLQKIKTGNEGDMYQRLLSYISLACYSFSNTAITQGNTQEAEKILQVYKLADPQNPDRAYLEALLYAKEGDDNKAINSLNEAVQLGLKDKAKIENEEAFAGIKNTDAFRQIVNRLPS